jgi:hypothetical protein
MNGRMYIEDILPRVLKRCLELKRENVTCRWRKLPIKELRNSYSSPNIFRIVK